MIRILLVEQTGLWRKALAAFLSGQDDLDVVAELASIDEAVRVARAVRPDVVMIGLSPLAEGDDPVAADVIAPLNCAVIALADPAAPGAVRGLLGPHVQGVFGKDGGPCALAQCVRRVARGDRVIDPTVAVAALCAPANPLTCRERQVLRVAASGVPSCEIAARLHLSVGTVRNYLSMIIQKIGGRNRMEAIRVAEEAGWI
jgi:two-component system, NarL family, response regulator DesR